MELVTKNGIIIGVENRNKEAMAAFYFNRLFTTLEWSEELLFDLYYFLDTNTQTSLEKNYRELLPKEDRENPLDIKSVHIAIIEKFGKTDGIKMILGVFNKLWKKYLERYKGFTPFKNVGPLLKKSFKLSKLEIELLKIVYVEDNVVQFGNFLSKLSFSQYMEVLALILNAEVDEINNLLNEDSNLVKYSMINIENFFPPFVSMEKLIIPLFSGAKPRKLSIGLTKPENEKTFSLQSFPLAKDEINIIKKIFTKPEPVNLLLYGNPGTGKSAFAFSLAKSVNRPVYTFDMMESGNDYRERPFRILAAVRHLPVNAILLIDEADSLLKSEKFDRIVDKNWLVTFLDQSNVSTIWIVNDLKDIQNAVKRRFVFSKEFKLWNIESRTKLWASLVSTSSISGEFTNTQVQNFAERYQVNAGNITSSIEAVSRLYQGGSIKTGEIEGVLEKILQENNHLVGGDRSSREHLNKTPYDPSIINSDQDIVPIKDTLIDFIKTPENQRISGINILFWGPPGTGKTAAARYIGNNLGVVLNEKKASDLMDSFVGETEKNIEEYFRGMTGDNQVALLDEADSFFINRATARNTWERLQTNELLTQMEKHSGVLFCCTNDLKSLDPAVLRRFTWKVEFSSMDKPAVRKLFIKYFPVPKGQSLAWKARLDNMSGITPGDFSILWKRYSLAGKSIPGTDVVLDDLEKELTYRQEKTAAIGF